ncbi:MAG: hypothetical protein ACI9XZ_001546 [Alphaproteobacteria bacterium]|jgi:hypothetical protein
MNRERHQVVGQISVEIDQDGLLTTESHVARTLLPSNFMHTVSPMGMFWPA